jgi:hypothetical protein
VQLAPSCTILLAVEILRCYGGHGTVKDTQFHAVQRRAVDDGEKRMKTFPVDVKIAGNCIAKSARELNAPYPNGHPATASKRRKEPIRITLRVAFSQTKDAQPTRKHARVERRVAASDDQCFLEAAAGGTAYSSWYCSRWYD